MAERHHFEARTGLPVDCLPSQAAPHELTHDDGYKATAMSLTAVRQAVDDHIEWKALKRDV